MGLLGEKIYLFSEVKGSVTLDNKPLSGARVIRMVDWKDREYTDEVTTDADGSFSFPPMKGNGRILLAQFVAYQTMTVEYEGTEWLIWRTVKIRPDLQGELVDDEHLDGVEIDVACELSEPERLIKLLGSVLRTRCFFRNPIGEEISE